MEHQLLPAIERKIEEYKSSHRGEEPLYILMPSDQAEKLMSEVKEKHHYDDDIVVTMLNGSKIVKHEMLNAGEVRLTNELPETSS